MSWGEEGWCGCCVTGIRKACCGNFWKSCKVSGGISECFWAFPDKRLKLFFNLKHFQPLKKLSNLHASNEPTIQLLWYVALTKLNEKSIFIATIFFCRSQFASWFLRALRSLLYIHLVACSSQTHTSYTTIIFLFCMSRTREILHASLPLARCHFSAHNFAFINELLFFPKGEFKVAGSVGGGKGWKFMA